MKNFFLSLLFLPSIAFSNSDDTPLATFDVAVTCVNGEQLTELSEKFDELPVFRARSLRQEANQIVSRALVLFFNPKERSYTLYEKFEEDLYCVISLGVGLEMLNPSDYSNKQKS